MSELPVDGQMVTLTAAQFAPAPATQPSVPLPEPRLICCTKSAIPLLNFPVNLPIGFGKPSGFLKSAPDADLRSVDSRAAVAVMISQRICTYIMISSRLRENGCSRQFSEIHRRGCEYA